MPTWGLTPAQLETEPWGIPSAWLLPGKTLTDPVHGDVYLNKLEAAFVDSPPMQRLRRVRQLGTTHVTYPGATHSRLSHCLGTLRAAQDLLDAVWNSRTNPQAKSFPDNLLAQWLRRGKLEAEFARATILARLGALLHDFCHVPMGHTVEDDLQLLDAHDHNLQRFRVLWGQVPEAVRGVVESDPQLMTELQRLIISKDEDASVDKGLYPFVGDIVGNTICADLIDYLQRDHKFTGLPIALGKRFMDSFFVVSDDHPLYAGHMVIGVERDGRIRNDIITELLKYLRYRYELTERVLTHHSKVAADAMLGKMLESWHEDIWLEAAANSSLDAGNAPQSRREFMLELDELVAAGKITPAVAIHIASSADTYARNKLEFEFSTRSDDGLIEELLRPPAGTESHLREDARRLAQSLVDRQLFKAIGIASGDSNRAISHQVHQLFSKVDERRALERDAADFAGIQAQDVVIWLPNPNMRLKVAEVLVHMNGVIAPLSEVEARSSDIASQHERLWAVTVYAPQEIRKDDKAANAVLAYLRDRTGLIYHRPDGTAVPGRFKLAEDYVEASLAANKVDRELLAATRSDYELSAATSDGSHDTFVHLVGTLQTAYEEQVLERTEGLTSEGP